MANMEIKTWSIDFLWIRLTFTWTFLFFGVLALERSGEASNNGDAKSAQIHTH